jgi:hypothetical protein
VLQLLTLAKTEMHQYNISKQVSEFFSADFSIFFPSLSLSILSPIRELLGKLAFFAHSLSRFSLSQYRMFLFMQSKQSP